MPLPQMAGDPGTLLQENAQAGQPAPTGEAGSSEVDPQQQVRGAVQQIGMVRKNVTQTLEAIASQFPAASKSARELQQAIDQAMQRLIKDIVKSVQTPEPEAPTTIR